MVLPVNTNIPSLQAQRSLSETERARKQTFAQLASGRRINSAADDAAGLAISEALRSQIGGSEQALRNAYDGISLTQTAEGALGQITDNTQRIQELALQAGNGTLSDSNRQAIQKEIDQLTQTNSQIVQTTEFNGTKLLNGATQTFQVGPNGTADNQVNVNTPNLTNLNGYNGNLNATGTIDVTTQAGAQAAIGRAKDDIAALSQARADVGAASNRFEASINTLSNSSLNAQASRSRIADTDFAEATSRLARQQILGQSGVAVLGQANLTPQAVLSLLR